MQVKGWHLYAHPLLLDQLERLIATVERDRKKNPKTYRSAANAKVLAALYKLMFEIIPEDPSRPIYRPGATLGEDRKHWFRAKFGGQRFRLFFRYRHGVIIYAWVNDENTLRTYGANTDAYKVFRSMLDKGNPPDHWDALLEAAERETAVERFEKAHRARED